jgi:hypothetical protein
VVAGVEVARGLADRRAFGSVVALHGPVIPYADGCDVLRVSTQRL